MKKLRSNHPAFRFLIEFWSKYGPLEAWHVEWALQHVDVLSQVRKAQALCLAGERQKNVYPVAKGMLGRTEISPDTGRRKLLNVALPGMAMMTTPHTIIRIPYAAIRDFKEKDPRIDTLIDVLVNKKKRHLSDIRVTD